MKIMYPSIDQNRQDINNNNNNSNSTNNNVHPQTVHVHMHQFCPCVHPYYAASYRPPILASPFPVQPLPRPYNLQHYQYTQFNLSPYNLQTPNAISQQHQQQQQQQQQQQSQQQQQQTNLNHQQQQQTTPSTIDFGPPLRDRRMYDNIEQDLNQDNNNNNNCKEREYFDDFLTVPQLDALQTVNMQENVQNFCISTENFTKFLEQGCILAEKIAIRNQHRPCFKNIQNLCNRTRSEILKPSNTVSNIHSQGMPWATKDFIYAFVRLINCWHMLKGYLDSKDGTLGNIDKELTSDFKSCYLSWEKETKELATHMVRIFSNLDNNVSNPNPSGSYPLRNKVVTNITNIPNNAIPIIQTSPQEKDNLKNVRGILHIPTKTSSCENVDCDNIESSPKDEDSDNEGRIYMKPGNYNVPKKTSSPESNQQPSIEFFETAQNVSAHYKKLASTKKDYVIPAIINAKSTNDKMWHDAQSAVPNLLNRINPIPSSTQDSQQDPSKLDDIESLKYFIDLDSGNQGSDIQEWLNNNNFFENNDMNDGSLNSPNHMDNIFTQTKPITVLQRSKSNNRYKENILDFQNDILTSLKNNKSIGNVEITSRTYRKRSENNDNNQKNSGLKSFNAFKKVTNNIWELEKGGLTPNTIILLEKVIRNLEQEKLTKQTYEKHARDDDGGTLDEGKKITLQSILKKIRSRKYQYLNEVIHDLRSMVVVRPEQTEVVSASFQEMYLSFEKKLDESLNNLFPNIDFSNITGDRNEELGPLTLKIQGKSEGDGDHQ